MPPTTMRLLGATLPSKPNADAGINVGMPKATAEAFKKCRRVNFMGGEKTIRGFEGEGEWQLTRVAIFGGATRLGRPNASDRRSVALFGTHVCASRGKLHAKF